MTTYTHTKDQVHDYRALYNRLSEGELTHCGKTVDEVGCPRHGATFCGGVVCRECGVSDFNCGICTVGAEKLGWESE